MNLMHLWKYPDGSWRRDNWVGLMVIAIAIFVTVSVLQKDKGIGTTTDTTEQTTDAARTITRERPMCKSYDTLDRVYALVARKDYDAADSLLRQEQARGNCAWTIVGSRIRIDQGGVLSSCIAPWGSTAACMWISNVAFQ
jgi:hypothetical protein